MCIVCVCVTLDGWTRSQFGDHNIGVTIHAIDPATFRPMSFTLGIKPAQRDAVSLRNAVHSLVYGFLGKDTEVLVMGAASDNASAEKLAAANVGQPGFDPAAVFSDIDRVSAQVTIRSIMCKEAEGHPSKCTIADLLGQAELFRLVLEQNPATWKVAFTNEIIIDVMDDNEIIIDVMDDSVDT